MLAVLLAISKEKQEKNKLIESLRTALFAFFIVFAERNFTKILSKYMKIKDFTKIKRRTKRKLCLHRQYSFACLFMANAF